MPHARVPAPVAGASRAGTELSHPRAPEPTHRQASRVGRDRPLGTSSSRAEPRFLIYFSVGKKSGMGSLSSGTLLQTLEVALHVSCHLTLGKRRGKMLLGYESPSVVEKEVIKMNRNGGKQKPLGGCCPFKRIFPWEKNSSHEEMTEQTL